MAMGRSSPAPPLRIPDGARLTVTRRSGQGRPLDKSAARTRSRDSRTAASGRPTTVKPGKPVGHVDLDGNPMAVDPDEDGRGNGGDHGASDRCGSVRRHPRAQRGSEFGHLESCSELVHAATRSTSAPYGPGVTAQIPSDRPRHLSSRPYADENTSARNSRPILGILLRPTRLRWTRAGRPLGGGRPSFARTRSSVSGLLHRDRQERTTGRKVGLIGGETTSRRPR